MSRLTQTIALLYQMQDADTEALYERLVEARREFFVSAMRRTAAEYGCFGQDVPQPRRQVLRELRRLSRRDAESITRTWNRDVAAQIERIYAENPRANRNTYFRRLEEWSAQRDSWKLPQIALVTETTTTELARRLFHKRNFPADQRYMFDGPPPTCEDCARLFAAGIVSTSYMRRHPTPVHIGCPHYWRAVKPPALECGKLWLG